MKAKFYSVSNCGSKLRYSNLKMTRGPLIKRITKFKKITKNTAESESQNVDAATAV